jgi:hypothetical protein
MERRRPGRPELYPVKKLIGFDQKMLDAVEAWAAKQHDKPSLSEAIRRMVELVLAADAAVAKPHRRP